MMLVHKDYKFRTIFDENRRNLMVIENPTIFSSFVQELFLEIPEEESKLVLSDNEMIIKKKEVLNCIVNPWSITLNEKRLLNRLNEILKKEIQSSGLLLENNRIYALIEKYILHIVDMMDFDLKYSCKSDVQGLLKLMDIQFNERPCTLIEKIVDYMKAVNELLNIECFVFVNLFSYLTEYEIEKMYEYVYYQKWHILLIEDKQPEKINYFTNVIIIDKDACEIEFTM